MVITSDTASKAVVTCTGDHFARLGFVFDNINNLSISNVKFVGCGGMFKGPNVSFINQTSNYSFFGVCQPAVLTFHGCTNLLLSHVEITHHLGFGVILLNSNGLINVNDLTVNDRMAHDDIVAPSYCFPSILSGSALLISQKTSNWMPLSTAQHTTITINNVTISNCYNWNYNGALVDALQTLSERQQNRSWSTPIVGGSAITVMMSEYSSSNVVVNLTNMHIANNTGLQASAIVMLFFDVQNNHVFLNNSTVLDNCVNDSDSNHFNIIGRSMTVYFLCSYGQYYSSSNLTPLTIKNSEFCEDVPLKCGNLGQQGSTTEIVINQMPQNYIEYTIAIEDSNFNGITGSPNHGLGIALYASTLKGSLYSTQLTILLKNITAYNFQCSVNDSIWSCYDVGVFAFNYVKNVTIMGGRFLNANGASVISAKYSDLYLLGSPEFCDNKAETFGAINLMQNSFLYLVEPLNARFAGNKALFGAGIYALEDYSRQCVIQFLPEKYYDQSNYTDMNIHIMMKDNIADLAGNSLYLTPIEKCNLYGKNMAEEIQNLSLLINKAFTFDNSKSHSPYEVMTKATQVCACDPNAKKIQCESTVIKRSAHPGETIYMHVAAFDILQKKSVYSLVNAQLSICELPGGSIFVPSDEIVNQISPNECTLLKYTIYHQTNASYPIQDVRLDIATYAHTPKFYVDLTLNACPQGFKPVNYSCQCVYDDHMLFSPSINCQIQNGSVSHPPNAWIGVTGNKLYGYSYLCPPTYCHSNLYNIDLSNTDSLCFGNRTGPLCGLCRDNLSIVFGSAECQECSNAYLVTIFLYAIAGILLVLLLFVLQMTLTSGTINGLIFYANLVGNNDGYLFGHQTQLNYLKIFIALINLELGFPLCFYDGMSEFVSRLLQFAFPIYIWTIVIIIIFASRYSTRLSKITGRHSVAVLATLIYLSYSKIVTTIVNALNPATVITEDGGRETVWYFDGSKQYASGLHLIPVILSILMIVFFVIPVTLLSTIVPFLGHVRLVNQYMPLTDAVFAPYKHKWRVWFGLRIILLLVALIITSVLRSYDIKLSLGIQHVLVIAFSLTQAFIRPFKNLAVELLDLFFMINFALIAFIVVYFYDDADYSTLLRGLTATLVTIGLGVFLGIIFYHSYKVIEPFFMKFCKRKPKISLLVNSIRNKASRGVYGINDTSSTGSHTPTHSEIPEVFERNPDYREPLLSLLDDDDNNI
jgi:hypothetical protein